VRGPGNHEASILSNRTYLGEAGIADLAQVWQKHGETMAEYIQRFREVKNRCYLTRILEKEAVELAS
jgi:hypothetical protein